MSNLIEYAKRELEEAGCFSDEEFYGGLTGNAVMELIKLFSEQGHSGMSASRVVNLFNKLAMFKPITPILNRDEDWIYESLGGTNQHRKLSSLFKKDKDSQPYYSNAIVFKNERGLTFTSNSVKLSKKSKEKISSSQYVKDFPFVPKTFYIDVEEVEYEKLKDGTLVKKEFGGWWETWIKDKKQLEEVFKYYDRK